MMHPGMASINAADRPADKPVQATAGGKLEGSYL